jgi:hypothetical protein
MESHVGTAVWGCTSLGMGWSFHIILAAGVLFPNFTLPSSPNAGYFKRDADGLNQSRRHIPPPRGRLLQVDLRHFQQGAGGAVKTCLLRGRFEPPRVAASARFPVSIRSKTCCQNPSPM